MKYLWILIGILAPAFAFALSYETDTLPYTDVPSDLETKVAISTLTELGILEGHPDGTFKPNVPLNRAEFVKIAMSLLPEEQGAISTRCFVDVDPNAWFAEYVCRAKMLDIVSGNAIAGLDASQWPFQPARSVKYEEALKVLSRIYGVPLLNVEGEWYERYVESAKNLTIDLRDSAAGSALTRGQMARLVIAFLAYSHNELDELRAAQTSSSSSQRTVFSAPSSSSVSSFSSTSSSIASSSSSSSAIYDSLLNDTSTDDSVLILGRVTHILGAVKLFADLEPVQADEFIIRLVAGNDSLQAINVYDDHGKLLGRATKDTATQFVLRVGNQNIVLPKRDDFSFYVRGVLSAQDSGGVSGGSIQIDEMGVEGTGVWSNRNYSVFTSGETFAENSVARSAITTVTSVGEDRSILVPGTDLQVGAFRFEGDTGHSAARLDITAIDFTAGITGIVTLSNPTLRVDGSSERHTCSIASNTITCSSLPATFGRLDDGPRTLRLFADIEIDSSSQSAGVQISINDPGTISSAGDITWTDGVTTFTWIESSSKPVARGTYYSY